MQEHSFRESQYCRYVPAEFAKLMLYFCGQIHLVKQKFSHSTQGSEPGQYSSSVNSIVHFQAFVYTVFSTDPLRVNASLRPMIYLVAEEGKGAHAPPQPSISTASIINLIL